MRTLRPVGVLHVSAQTIATARAPLALGLAAAMVDAHGAMLQARDCDSLYVELCTSLVQGGLRSALVRVCDPETDQLVTVACAGEPTPAEHAIQPRDAHAAPTRVR